MVNFIWLIYGYLLQIVSLEVPCLNAMDCLCVFLARIPAWGVIAGQAMRIVAVNSGQKSAMMSGMCIYDCWTLQLDEHSQFIC